MDKVTVSSFQSSLNILQVSLCECQSKVQQEKCLSIPHNAVITLIFFPPISSVLEITFMFQTSHLTLLSDKSVSQNSLSDLTQDTDSGNGFSLRYLNAFKVFLMVGYQYLCTN